MCGIAGFAGAGDRAVLDAMTARIAHRGPDGAGAYADAARPVFLGHRRLAILDLALGAQPLWNETGDVAVVFNGEIYNHRALRRELEALGHRFATDHSDTETLVHGYEQWGRALPGRLNGMFAFAVYDLRRGLLFLARDRFGEKPLYYAPLADVFVFGSELSALRAHPAVARRGLSATGLRKYFAHGFLPAPHTVIDGVLKLPQGHWLEHEVDTGRTTSACWWRYEIEPDSAPPGGVEAWTDALEETLFRAVADRLESDVPLGVFLSGGIDSSLIVAAACRAQPADSVAAFSVGFDEPSFDESAYAAEMARHAGVRHCVETCTAADAQALLPALLAALDEPLGDSSVLPTYMLSRFTARHVKVALSGDGGDELFGGYDPFRVLAKARAYHALVPRPVHRAVALLASRLPVSDRNMSFDFKVNRGLRGLDLAPKFWNPVWLGLASPTEVGALLSEPVDIHELYAEAIDAWDRSRARSLLDRSMEFYAGFYLPDGVLTKVDRASMLNGLEARAPFLDAGVADLARRLPADVKVRGGVGKWLLRRVAARHLPASLSARPKKGFGMPVAAWLRGMPPPEASAQRYGLNDRLLRRMWHEHSRRARDHRGALWGWLTLHHSLGTAA